VNATDVLIFKCCCYLTCIVHSPNSCLFLVDSPRIYTSTNPWRLTASFKAVSSTREEYLAVIDHLKAVLPVSKGKRRPKNEQNHADLIHRLEQRIGTIDQEINVSLHAVYYSFLSIPSQPFSSTLDLHFPLRSFYACWVFHA